MTNAELEPTRAQVPALAATPATTFTADDIAVPRIYIGNDLSKAVKKRIVELGDVYLADGADDEEPQVIWEFNSDEPGPVFHVLSRYKNLSLTESGEFNTWELGDPSAPEDAKLNYNYTLCLPEVDSEMPALIGLTSSGARTAKQINTVLARNAALGPVYNTAFRLSSVKRNSKSYEWYVAQAAVTTPEPANVAIAASMFDVVGHSLNQPSSRRQEPGI